MSDPSVIEQLDAPWADGRSPIFALIEAAVAARGDAAEEIELDLPEPDVEEIRWAAGARDNMFGSPDRSRRQIGARKIAAAVGKVVRRPSARDAGHLYGLLCDVETISVIDEVLVRVTDEIGEHRPALAALARRLIREAPDVEPVKFAVALLGVSGTAEDVALVSTAGCYEEITLYSVVAMTNLLTEPEWAIWDLAKRVHGWGRINAVERLEGVEDSAIRSWMLRGGCSNRIMSEYLAHVCANTGGLREALEASEIDDALLSGAAVILHALIEGGPVPDIGAYDDGAAACRSFLKHVSAAAPKDLFVLLTVLRIKELVDEANADPPSAAADWPAEARLDVRTLAMSIMADPAWREAAEAGLRAEDESAFFQAAQAAEKLGVDPWPARFHRQRERSSDQLFFLMQTDDPARIDQVLDLAREQLDLDLVGSGPTKSLGLGSEYKNDRALDCIVQELRRFPGKGWDLIETALRGRTTRLRNMAVKALDAWRREAWPAEAVDALRAAAEREPDADAKARMEKLLRGEPLD